MQETLFPYLPAWENAKFEPPAKRIINFNDVSEYQQRPIHQEYLEFLTDLQKAVLSKKISDTPDSQKFSIFKPWF